MASPVKTRLVRIGNSHGIRIPKPLVEQAGLTGALELEVQSGQLIVRSARKARQGWEAAFEEMARLGEDRLLDAEPLAQTTWEAGEWHW